MYSNGDVMQETASTGEISTRVELDLTCSPENFGKTFVEMEENDTDRFINETVDNTKSNTNL